MKTEVAKKYTDKESR